MIFFIFGTCLKVRHNTKCFLASKFNKKDMLGTKIKRNNVGITLSHKYYIEKFLRKFDVTPLKYL